MVCMIASIIIEKGDYVDAGDVYRNHPAETPDTFCCTFKYPSFLATWTLCYTNNTWHNDWSICFQGEQASLFLTENGPGTHA